MESSLYFQGYFTRAVKVNTVRLGQNDHYFVNISLKDFSIRIMFHWTLFWPSNRQMGVNDDIYLPNIWQAVTWIIDNAYIWCPMTSLGLNELSERYAFLKVGERGGGEYICQWIRSIFQYKFQISSLKYLPLCKTSITRPTLERR